MVSDGDSIDVDVCISSCKTELFVQAVILDLDGTLINTMDDFCNSVNKVLLEAGFNSLPRTLLASMFNDGLTLLQILERSLAITQGQTLDAIMQKVKCTYSEVSKKGVKLIGGAREAIRLLSESGVSIGLATGRRMPHPVLGEMLVEMGLFPYFKYVVSGLDVDRRKPFPDIILHCAEGLKVPKSRCLSIGDSVVDIEAGKAAGVLTAAVLTGAGDKKSLRALKPNFLAADLLELIRNLHEKGILIPKNG